MKKRYCTIYKSSRKAELYLYVDRQKLLDELPEDLLNDLGNLEEVMTLLISSERKLARVKAGQVLRDIEEKGYFLQMPPALFPGATSNG